MDSVQESQRERWDLVAHEQEGLHDSEVGLHRRVEHLRESE